MTYRRQQCVVTLQQQRAQLLPAQTVQLMLPQYPLVVVRVQVMGEVAVTPVIKYIQGLVMLQGHLLIRQKTLYKLK